MMTARRREGVSHTDSLGPGVLPVPADGCPSPRDPTAVTPPISFASQVIFLPYFSHIPSSPAEAETYWPRVLILCGEKGKFLSPFLILFRETSPPPSL